MKRTMVLFLITLLMISFSLNISAQEEPTKYQAFYVSDDLVKSSMVPEYEVALKDYIAIYAENQYPYPLSMYSTNDFHYYSVTPLNSTSYSELDSLRKYRKIAYSKNPEKWDAMWKKFEGTYDYNKGQIIFLNRDLSYVPENPRLKPEEEKFSYWVFTYVKVGKTKEFVENIKKWKELYKSNNISLGFDIFYGGFGTEQPLFLWHMTGKDIADFMENSNSISEVLGEEAKVLREQTRKLTRKIDIKYGWYRPEFSYIPEKKE